MSALSDFLRSQAIDEAPADPADEGGPTRTERLTKFLRGLEPDDPAQKARLAREMQTRTGPAKSGLEMLGTLGSSVAGQAVGGIRGLLTLAGTGGDLDAAVRNIKATEDAMTYQPRTEGGRAGLEAVGKIVEPVNEWAKEHIADPVGEVSPAAGAAVLAGANFIPGPGKAAKAVAGGVRKTAKAVKAAEGAEVAGQAAERAVEAPAGAPDKLVAAPKEIDLPDTFQSGEKEGILRGTEGFAIEGSRPGGGLTQKDVNRMRANYLRHMEAGTPFRRWYDDTSSDLFDLTEHQPEKADRLATMLAVTSSGTDVGSNAMAGFKNYNQHLVGDPMTAGRYPTAMAASTEEALANPEATAAGLKRSPFNAGLAVHWRGPEFANRATHDIRDVRAYGILDPNTLNDPKKLGVWSKGLSDAQHRFLDEQADWLTKKAIDTKMGGVDDWTNYRAQAAAWISQKMEQDGLSFEEAAKHYGDYIRRNSAQITRSWVPGTNTGHLQGMSPAQQEHFSALMEGANQGPGGGDLIAQRMGALSAKTLPNAGFYEGVTEPGFASQIPVGRATGSSQIDPSSAKVMRAGAGLHSMLGAQKQGAWSYTGDATPLGRAGAARFTLPDKRALTVEELRRIAPDMERAGADLTQVNPRGAESLWFGGPRTKEQIAGLRQAAGQHGLDVEFVEHSGEALPDSPEQFSVKPFREAIRAAGPRVEENINTGVPEIAGELAARAASAAKEYGLVQAPWYAKLMSEFKAGGLPAVDRLVKKGIVPATALAVLGLTRQAASGEEATQ